MLLLVLVVVCAGFYFIISFYKDFKLLGTHRKNDSIRERKKMFKLIA